MNFHPPRVAPDLLLHLDAVLAIQQLAHYDLMSRTPPANFKPSDVSQLCTAAVLAEQSGADGIVLGIGAQTALQASEIAGIHAELVNGVHLTLPCDPDLIDFACQQRVKSVCLQGLSSAEAVPGLARELTLELAHVRSVVEQLQACGIEVSLPLDANLPQLQLAAQTGIRHVVVNTRAYADAVLAQDLQTSSQLVEQYREFSHAALKLGIRLAAGGGLTLHNIGALAALNEFAAFHLGDSVLLQAFFSGWPTAIRQIKAEIVRASLESR